MQVPIKDRAYGQYSIVVVMHRKLTKMSVLLGGRQKLKRLGAKSAPGEIF
jgi:hypothetical protein